MKVFTRSDTYEQVKPDKIIALREKMEDASRYSRYPFRLIPSFRKNETWAVNTLTYTVQDVYELLNKAIRIVEDTEQYTEYLLNKTFGNPADSGHYSIPPGTLRFYAPDLICFYNGKTWRKIKL